MKNALNISVITTYAYLITGDLKILLPQFVRVYI